MLKWLSIASSVGIQLLAVVCCSAIAAPRQPLIPPAGIEAKPSPLRICAAKHQPPFSLEDKSGYENKIAVVLAETLGREPQFVWSPKPAIYLVRDFLDKRLCDVIIGLDTGDPRVLTTTPYMRSGYVFVSRADRGLQARSWSDPELKKLAHIAVPFGSPAEIMLKEIGRYEDEMSYLYSLVNFRSPRNQYTQIDPSRMIDEVVNGTAGLAVAFAPEIARFVKLSPIPLRMVLIEDDARRADGERVPLRYDQSIGVRRDDKALLDELNAALRRAQPKIDEILVSEGIPTLPIEHQPAAESK
ncbi:MAG TPA: methanol oxidation system protein MoxJ [Methylocella sp.]|nr:methanol oxidation system protein MoxJ [Methylocella sp.]